MTGAAAPTRLAHVQALRAVAVGGVLIFHFWPHALPGGFLGVDIFFVISGFLITGGIVRQVERRQFSFRQFYIRRIRRLIPAAALVALVSGVVAWFVQPISLWLDTFSELLASTLYVQNWFLVYKGNDYFAGSPSLAQHYWSLSVEEQFYLIWPVIIVLAGWIGHRTGGVRRGVIVALGALTLASFITSVVVTPQDWQLSFFATHIRAWEFGVGALLALAPTPERRPWHAAVGWAGLVVLAVCLYVYRGTWPFPGWIGAIPVLATALCLWGGFGQGRRALSRVVLSPPVLWAGDISYSLYLWHWPIIVLAPWVLEGETSLPVDLGLVVLCFLLAWVTKTQVEDRFREGGVVLVRGVDPLRRPSIVVATVLPLVVVVGCVLQLSTITAASSRAAALEGQALASDLPCYGVEALDDPSCEPPFGDELIPALSTAYVDFTQSPENNECMQTVTASTVIRCVFGDPHSDTTVALVGDSHGLAWLPAAQVAAEERGWRLLTYLRGACPVSAAVTKRYVPGEQELCDAWSRDVIEEVVTDPEVDLVMTAALNTITWVPTEGRSPYETGVEGYAQAWNRWAEAGKRVLVMEETPLPRDDVLECLSQQPARACAQPESQVDQPGPSPLHAAVDRLRADGQPVDLMPVRDLFCADDACPAVVGNIVVYVDGDHVSQPYMRTLGPRVGEAWDALVNAG
ncbi:acyltransferase family protein [Ornithinimicrobium pratense]|uniref:acyltransferase family protein n=1 Tax=Ornithinimicrobium pratense TaxID=2593973 RepID=UPI00178830ED|nr:acyltransferase family protein [Ornithinimicrobium pratense]